MWEKYTMSTCYFTLFCATVVCTIAMLYFNAAWMKIAHESERKNRLHIWANPSSWVGEFICVQYAYAIVVADIVIRMEHCWKRNHRCYVIVGSIFFSIDICTNKKSLWINKIKMYVKHRFGLLVRLSNQASVVVYRWWQPTKMTINQPDNLLAVKSQV